jgi:hypothetical protein
MGLFNKKEKVPEIPTSPALPELPKLQPIEQKKELPELPSFPASPKNDNLNQEMVKSAVTDIPSLGEKEISEQVATLPVSEGPKEESMIPPKPSIESSIPSPPEMPLSPKEPEPIVKKEVSIPTTPSPSKTDQHHNEPIFIRIDKFQTAQKNFDNIKEKVGQIESVLKKIKDVKAQEEEELKGWTKDVEKIKSRLGEINDDIFNQI